MKIKKIALMASFILGLTSTCYASQTKQTLPVKPDVSIIKTLASTNKNVVVPSTFNTHNTLLDQMLKEEKKAFKKSRTEKAISEALADEASKVTRKNPFNYFLKQLFGG